MKKGKIIHIATKIVDFLLIVCVFVIISLVVNTDQKTIITKKNYKDIKIPKLISQDEKINPN